MAIHQQKDKQLLGEIYQSHHSWLFAWLQTRLNSSESAADIAHDIFVKILAGDAVSKVNEPRAYLTTLARRSVANYWRRQSIESAYLEAIQTLPEPQLPSEEERAIVIESLLAISEKLQGLPLVVKQAFLYSQLDGLKQQQIADKLNISLSTVKRYLLQAITHCFFAISPQ